MSNKIRFLAVDIETGDPGQDNGLNYLASIISISAAWRNSEGIPVTKCWLITMGDLFHPMESVPKVQHELQTLVEQADKIVFHNGTFDLSRLFGKGYLREHHVRGKIIDTQYMGRLAGPARRVGLEYLVKQYKIRPDLFEEWSTFKINRKNLHKEIVLDVIRYNDLDAIMTLELSEVLWEKCLEFYTEDQIMHWMDFIRVMSKVVVNGIKVDPDKLMAERTRVGDLRRAMESAYRGMGIDTVNSNGQINAWMCNHDVRLPWVMTDGKVPVRSFGKEALNIYRMELAEQHSDVRRFRRDFKAAEENPEFLMDALRCETVSERIRLMAMLLGISSLRTLVKREETVEGMLNKYPDPDDFIHPNYSVGRTVTYRLASSEPNGQNIPRTLKWWAPYVAADYSQAEARFAGLLSLDETMCGIYQRGEDLHEQTALRMFGNGTGEDRSNAKTVNFSTLYGGGVGRVSAGCNVTMAKARQFLTDHRAMYPDLHKLARKAAAMWVDRGWIKLWDGRRIWLPDHERPDKYGKGGRAYKAMNNVIQGGVAVIVEEAMHTFDDLDYTMRGQKHDEIAFDDKHWQDVNEIKAVMTAALPPEWTHRVEPPIYMIADVDHKE